MPLKFYTKTGKIINISWSDELSWARPYISENRRGTKPRNFEDILKEGDLIWLKRDVVTNNISVTQVPEAQSALISLEANTGSILAWLEDMISF